MSERDNSATSGTPEGETIEWTAQDEAAADRAMARLNERWAAQEARGVDVDAAMLAEIEALGEDEADD